MSDVRLRFASFNIRRPTLSDGENHWVLRRDFVADVIRDTIAPDVIGLQECDVVQARYLAEQLPDYEWAGVGRADGREGGEMVPIFHRRGAVERLDVCHFWLSETPEVAGSRSWQSSLPRMVTWARFRVGGKAGQEFCFFNTHFDHESGKAREEGAKLLAARIADVAPVPCVVAGDFNAVPGSGPYATLAAAGLRDAAPVDAEGTFHGFAGLPRDRIDWLLTTPQWQEVSYSTERVQRADRWPSDHFPIEASAVLR